MNPYRTVFKNLLFGGILILCSCANSMNTVPLTYPAKPIYLKINVPEKKYPVAVAMVVDDKALEPYILVSPYCTSIRTEYILVGRFIPQVYKVFLDNHFETTAVLSDNETETAPPYKLRTKIAVSKIKKVFFRKDPLGCQVYIELDILFEDRRGKPVLNKKIFGKNYDVCRCSDDMYDPMVSAALTQAFNALSKELQASKAFNDYIVEGNR